MRARARRRARAGAHRGRRRGKRGGRLKKLTAPSYLASARPKSARSAAKRATHTARLLMVGLLRQDGRRAGGGGRRVTP
jgi:hypothetical protein